MHLPYGGSCRVAAGGGCFAAEERCHPESQPGQKAAGHKAQVTRGLFDPGAPHTTELWFGGTVVVAGARVELADCNPLEAYPRCLKIAVSTLTPGQANMDNRETSNRHRACLAAGLRIGERWLRWCPDGAPGISMGITATNPDSGKPEERVKGG